MKNQKFHWFLDTRGRREIIFNQRFNMTKIQAKFDKYYQNFEQTEEELIDFIEQQHQ